MAGGNRLPIPASNVGSRIFVNVSCGAGMEGAECGGGFTDPNGYAAVVYLFAADITLEQAAGPTASGVGGELATSSTVGGTSDLTFNASDAGSGVYEAVFSVDGQVVQRTVIDENGGRCRDVGQTTDGRPAFLYVQPCLAAVSADVGFDSTRVSDGQHHLVVSVVDAAGNSAPVIDRNISISNAAAGAQGGPSSTGAGTSGANIGGIPSGAGAGGAGALNGTNASATATLSAIWKGSKSARLTTAYGRPETILGRLRGPGGAPIAGASIDLTATAADQGARAVSMRSPRTAPDGRFTVHLPRGLSSRTLRFAYRQHLGDPLPVTTRTLTLSVHAALALSITPRTASVGRRIFFRGRLLGGLIPRGGKQLVLEARSPRGRWLEFKVVRAEAHGRFRASYRFRLRGPARYQFRVVSEAESDYPFAAGVSRVVNVRER